ncbi:MAG TPA: type II toxin-antitoxin system RelE/ParE family toxin [Bradyrhizobium sp.]|jgi:putative addiction module killer protein|nr:type II toxin-antitoxin system RelE/ParE family toxin [Bradyrhizobium sp.]
MPEIRYYVAGSGEEPFAEWFAELDGAAAAKIARALVRMEQGNLSYIKSVGEGVLEYRVDFGPGYRIYFGRDGDTIVVLLTGGTKKRQQRDIDMAHANWRDYKRSKRGRARTDGD